MENPRVKIFVLLALFIISRSFLYSQQELTTHQLAGQMNVITSAVPFLMIAPESRGGAMGEVGVALSPDVNSMHWNPSKYAFIESQFGVSLSYTPWLRKLVDDINLSYLTGYYRLDNRQAIAASMRYFSLGNIVFTNISGQKVRDFRPNEFAIDIGYALKLHERISGAVAMRYIYSNLTGGFSAGGTETHAGHSVAGDISAFYTNPDISIAQRDAVWNFGINISNIGSKISYTDDSEKNFIPTNLRLGTALSMELDDYNSITFSTDINKLLIPTPPVYSPDNDSIVAGKDSDVFPIKGIFQSFSDAPGGMEEELHEIIYTFGLEYWYAKQFAIRTGYFHEHDTKGNRKYFTAGVGLKLNVFGLNFSYLIPVNQRNPLENTVRFSLLFDLDSFNNQGEDD